MENFTYFFLMSVMGILVDGMIGWFTAGVNCDELCCEGWERERDGVRGLYSNQVVHCQMSGTMRGRAQQSRREYSGR